MQLGLEMYAALFKTPQWQRLVISHNKISCRYQLNGYLIYHLVQWRMKFWNRAMNPYHHLLQLFTSTKRGSWLKKSVN